MSFTSLTRFFEEQGKIAAARRTLKLLPESRSILAARMQGESSWIFLSEVRPGRHITKLNNAHGRVLRDTGLCFVMHDFRHTAATRWAERGMPLATLAKILGHFNLRSVMKHVHPSQDHMDEAMLRFGESEKKVNYRSRENAKQGDSTGSSVDERELPSGLYATEDKGKIQ